MSSSILLSVRPGEMYAPAKEFHNGWGTGPVVWDDLSRRYLGYKDHGWLRPGAQQQALWDLWKNRAVPFSHRAVLMFTFDRAYVTKLDYKRFAADLRYYLADCAVESSHINHWPAIAEFFEIQPDYHAIGLWVTTVTTNPFDGPYNEEKEAYDPFDWSKAFDIYTELDSVERSTRDDLYGVKS